MKRLMLSLAAAVMLLTNMGFASPAFADGSAPVAENLELRTYRNVSVGGRLSAYDADKDVVDYEITTQPVKGYIELGTDGSFVYTPGQDKKGKDYFGYKAIDSQGNVSQEATVIVKIEKQQKKDISYADMKGTAEEYAAVVLSERGIFTGEKIGDQYCFHPQREVSRGDFLSMCMLACDESAFAGAVSTCYSDDEAIPDWMKAYVASASMNGFDEIWRYDSASAFSPEKAISREEAVMLLNNTLGLNDVRYVELDDSMEHATAQACANLSASGILDDMDHSDEKLTRAEAAELLSKALELISKR